MTGALKVPPLFTRAEKGLKMEHLLEVKNLSVSIDGPAGEVQAVRDVSFSLKKGEVLAIVGESGCGKSVLCKSIMKLLPPSAKIKEGSICVNGQDITCYREKEMQKLRGRVFSMIFQDPMTSLNPLKTIGKQNQEAVELHQGLKGKAAKEKTLEYLRDVGITDAEKRFDQYPHEFSGGMRQRVVIAIAVACNPQILICDEPTTALDVTIQAQILELLKEMRVKYNLTIILITHDLGVVANIADRIVVMYAGQIVERGTSIEVFHHPRHPYTNALLEAVPRLDLQNKQQLASIEGTPPDLIAPPKGCPFCTRCKYCMEICCEQQPPVLNFGDGHEASCWLYQLETPAADAPFTQEAHYEG